MYHINSTNYYFWFSKLVFNLFTFCSRQEEDGKTFCIKQQSRNKHLLLRLQTSGLLQLLEQRNQTQTPFAATGRNSVSFLKRAIQCIQCKQNDEKKIGLIAYGLEWVLLHYQKQPQVWHTSTQHPFMLVGATRTFHHSTRVFRPVTVNSRKRLHKDKNRDKKLAYQRH